MIRKVHIISLLLLTFLCLLSTRLNAEPVNLLIDPSADAYADDWQSSGDVAVEEVDGDPCFVIRNGGTFAQDIPMYEDDAGKFLLLAGLASRERINTYGSITDLPYLHGYMIDKLNMENLSGAFIESHFQISSHALSYMARAQNDWFVMGGVFFIPENTKMIRVFLKQASQRGVPHNGSAARFDELGAFLFTSKSEAISFFNAYYYQ